jgi:hypothetical protein
MEREPGVIVAFCGKTYLEADSGLSPDPPSRARELLRRVRAFFPEARLVPRSKDPIERARQALDETCRDGQHVFP